MLTTLSCQDDNIPCHADNSSDCQIRDIHLLFTRLSIYTSVKLIIQLINSHKTHLDTYHTLVTIKVRTLHVGSQSLGEYTQAI